jgi:hypothetical protein
MAADTPITATRLSVPWHSDAADVPHFISLSHLTHLDLGIAEGVAALAPQLPNLQSLALYLPLLESSARATHGCSLLSGHVARMRQQGIAVKPCESFALFMAGGLAEQTGTVASPDTAGAALPDSAN